MQRRARKKKALARRNTRLVLSKFNLAGRLYSFLLLVASSSTFSHPIFSLSPFPSSIHLASISVQTNHPSSLPSFEQVSRAFTFGRLPPPSSSLDPFQMSKRDSRRRRKCRKKKKKKKKTSVSMDEMSVRRLKHDSPHTLGTARRASSSMEQSCTASFNQEDEKEKKKKLQQQF